MRDARVTAPAEVLVVDSRAEAEQGGLAEALRGLPAVCKASSVEAALLVAARRRPAVALVHAGLDAGPGRPGAGVIVAAELARRQQGLSLLLLGAPRDLSGWSLLHELGATARFVPDSGSAEDLARLLALLLGEASARDDLAAALRAVPLVDGAPLGAMRLHAFTEGVERRLIETALQQARSLHGVARLLGLGEAGLRARMRKLGMRPGTREPVRSLRDRLLVVGAGPASRAFAATLDQGPCAVLHLSAGALHAGAEAKGGARAAVIEVDGEDAVVDAWALRRVAPAIPLVLHGAASAKVSSLLTTFGGMPAVLSTDALASSVSTAVEALVTLGRLSCAADARCVSLGGAGQGPVAPPTTDLRDVISRVEHDLVDLALAQEPTREKAADLLGISVRATYRRRTA